jgi:tetratricopeptide (TPR) repeat protein
MFQFELDPQELIKLLRARWHQPWTLVIVLVVATGLLLWLFMGVSLDEISLPEYVLLAVVLALIILVWRLTTRLPHSPKGTIGFAVAISSETKYQRERLAKDFVDELRLLLSQGNLKYRFSLVDFPEYYALKVQTAEDAITYLRRSRCHFMVYGRTRIRSIQGRSQHVLNLAGVVRHKPIPDEISKSLSYEFGELFPGRLVVAPENDLFSFEFTSEWVNTVSRYVIGIAALLSDDLEYAQSLFENLSQRVKQSQTHFPAITKIIQRLPVRLGEVYLTQSMRAASEWEKTRSPEPLQRMKSNLDKMEEIVPDNYQAHLLRAIWHFVTNRDVSAGRQELRKCKNEKDATWRYSDAFLLAYTGEVKRARKRYETAFQHYCDPAVPAQVEGFISWVIDQEPDKVQLHFCLGIINLFAKDDRESAQRDLERFLETCPQNRFLEERQLAQDYLKQVRA